MVWKPREKELTAEEAIEQAAKELAPFWYGCSPLLAGILEDGIFLTLPLSE